MPLEPGGGGGGGGPFFPDALGIGGGGGAPFLPGIGGGGGAPFFAAAPGSGGGGGGAAFFPDAPGNGGGAGGAAFLLPGGRGGGGGGAAFFLVVAGTAGTAAAEDPVAEAGLSIFWPSCVVDASVAAVDFTSLSSSMLPSLRGRGNPCCCCNCRSNPLKSLSATCCRFNLFACAATRTARSNGLHSESDRTSLLVESGDKSPSAASAAARSWFNDIPDGTKPGGEELSKGTAAVRISPVSLSTNKLRNAEIALAGKESAIAAAAAGDTKGLKAAGCNRGKTIPPPPPPAAAATPLAGVTRPVFRPAGVAYMLLSEEAGTAGNGVPSAVTEYTACPAALIPAPVPPAARPAAPRRGLAIPDPSKALASPVLGSPR